MPFSPSILALALLLQSPAPSADHSANAVYLALLADGLVEGGIKVPLPPPAFADGLDAAAGLAAIRGVAGDDRAVKELLRDSVSAPFSPQGPRREGRRRHDPGRRPVLRRPCRARRDRPRRVAGPGRPGRRRGGQHAVRHPDPRPPRPSRSGGSNCPRSLAGGSAWYSHATGRLLDRIAVEATDRLVATRTADSLLVAARTDPAFDADAAFPNQWSGIVRKGDEETVGPRKAYGGGGSYVKLTRIAAMPGLLFVEAHLAFVEPTAWFRGNPILRSKFGPDRRGPGSPDPSRNREEPREEMTISGIVHLLERSDGPPKRAFRPAMLFFLARSPIF